MDKPASGLSAIFLAHRDTLRRFLRARLGNADEADEALQDVWLKLEDKEPVTPIADPLAYLFRMAENAARDRRRSAARQRGREVKWVEGAHGPSGDRNPVPTPERNAINRDRLWRIREALMALPDRTQQVFQAFRIEGRAQKDIAAEFGISVSAVEKHLQRAYKTVIAVRRAEEDAERNGE